MYDTKNTGLNLHIQSRFANVSEDSCEVNAHHGDQNAQDAIDPEDVDEYGQQDTAAETGCHTADDEYGQQDTAAETGCHTADRANGETMFSQWSRLPPLYYMQAASHVLSKSLVSGGLDSG